MSKVLKVVAIVAAIASVVATAGGSLGILGAVGGASLFGVSAALLTGISVAASLGASLLAPRPKPPRASSADRDRLFASINPRAPRAMVFGRTAMATDIRDQEFTGANKEFLHRFIVVASHKCQAIEEIWFDDKLAWSLGGGVQGEYSGYLTVTPILEGSAGNAINISARMGTTRRYSGCAYVHLRYKLTGNSKKTDSPFAQSIPSRMTIVGKGIACYDPRLDTTVGGSGPQRANDQSTWVWSDSASRNTKLQELTYLLGWKINGKLAVGKGVPPARIDLASYITAANACDETMTLAAGGTEPRYRTDGVVNEADDMGIVLDQFKSSSNSLIDDADGKIRTLVLSNDLGSPVASFGPDDILGNVQWKPFSDLTDRFNIVRGTFTDSSANSLYQSVEYPEVALASTDGVERAYTVDFPLVQSASQAQRLAKQRLQRAQYAGTLNCQMQSTAWRVQKNDVITLTFTPLGFSNKLFRLVATSVRVDGIVDVTLREENAAVYAWDMNESAPILAAAPTTYSYTDNPIYQDLSFEPSYQFPDPPPGEAGGIGHIYIDATGRKYRFAGSSFLFGGQPVQFGGQDLYASGYVDAQDQLTIELANRLDNIDDDDIIDPSEKINILIPAIAAFAATYTSVTANAAVAGISIVNLNTKRAAWLDFTAAINPPVTDTSVSSPVTRGSLDQVRDQYDSELKEVQKRAIEAMTAAKSPDLTGNLQWDIAGDYATGAVTTALPVDRRFKGMEGQTDLSATTSFVLSGVSASVVMTVNNTAGSIDRGVVTLGVGTTGSGTATLTATLPGGGVVSRVITITKTNGNAPTGGGSGATFAQDTSFNNITGSAHTQMSDELIVRSDSSGNIRLSIDLTYSAAGGSAFRTPSFKASYATSSGGSLTDLFSESSGSTCIGGTEPEDGYYTRDEAIFAMPAANTDYYFKLQGRRSSGTGSISFNGNSFTVRQ